MSDRQTDHEQRQQLAEQWRQLGEKLRERSRRRFEKMIEMLTTSALVESEDDEEEIDNIYRIH